MFTKANATEKARPVERAIADRIVMNVLLWCRMLDFRLWLASFFARASCLHLPDSRKTPLRDNLAK
jgi:hypothetical protein